MARQTRQQRRARREAQAESAQQRAAARPRMRAVPAPAVEAPARPERRGLPGVRFVREAWAELQKVEWPRQQQLIQGTVVVLVACLIVGVYLWGNDEIWRRVVNHLLIK